ncbi:hypothetical protein BC829DRAFT_391022 [Chytridium lagenaria]|nr:hypothetical protein BC829DRAFT_391022 [Chytridium lagenaria]
MVKVVSKMKSKQALRHDPLHMEILKQKNLETPEAILPPTQVKKQRRGAARGAGKDASTKLKPSNDDEGMSDAEDPKESFVDAKTSKRILNIVRDQQMEISRENDDGFRSVK